MKIAAYLCNTYENLNSDSWQTLSERNLTNYFHRYAIPLQVTRFNDERVQKLISTTIQSGVPTNKTNPLVRKIFRIYDFLNSNNDYGVFVDLGNSGGFPKFI